jgi:transposase
MTLNQSIRKLIKSWLEEGYKASKIYSLLKYQTSKATVYRWVDRILKSGISAKTSPGRPRSVRTKSFTAKVKRNLLTNKKHKSARRIARDEGCSPRTICRIIQDDLHLKAYKKIRVPALTASHVKKRNAFSHWIRNRFTKLSCRKILFSDEKVFDQDGQYNRQNDRVYAESRQATKRIHGFAS